MFAPPLKEQCVLDRKTILNQRKSSQKKKKINTESNVKIDITKPLAKSMLIRLMNVTRYQEKQYYHVNNVVVLTKWKQKFHLCLECERIDNF